MLLSNKIAPHCFALGAMFFAVGAVRGASVIQTQSTSTINDSNTANPSQTLTFDGFDPTLGVLNYVTISGSANATPFVWVYNISSTNSYAFTNAMAVVPVTVTGPNSASTTASITQSVASGTAGPGQTNYQGVQQAVTFSNINVPASQFASYIGGNQSVPVTFMLDQGTYSGTTTTNQLFFGGSAAAAATLTVDYEYTAVPATGIALPAGIFTVLIAGAGTLKRLRPSL